VLCTQPVIPMGPSMLDELKILIVSANAARREHLQSLLEPKVSYVLTARDGDEALRYFDQTYFDLVFTELLMPHMGGLELSEHLRERFPEVFVVLCADAKTEVAKPETEQSGFDYILKSSERDELLALTERIAEQKHLLDKSFYPHQDRRKTYRFENIIGKTPEMLDIYNRIQDVAKSDILVLITGESGTGKELVANAIHYTSVRRKKPYVKINCASMPEGLIESELFGHEKGAFTTAIMQKKGKFELAHGGTLFLDEIGEMPLQMQAKLLRVLDDGNFERVGGTKTIHTDVRIICATNKDIQQEVSEKRIREDLYYRIKAASVHVPPLRERKADIPLLATYFTSVYSRKNNKSLEGVSKASHNILRAYEWPGNVRELSHVIEQAVVFCKGREITPECLPEDIQRPPRLRGSTLRLPSRSLPLAEETLIRKVLGETNWNLKQAARELDIARGTLYSKMKKYGIERPE
jgi:DNA-binding NtrC family response regulator